MFFMNDENYPYYAVIFISKKVEEDNGYDVEAEKIENIVNNFPGYLGIDSVRNDDNVGVTVSYWDSLESINNWRFNLDHMEAKEKGKEIWYEKYTIRVCEVLLEKSFGL